MDCSIDKRKAGSIDKREGGSKDGSIDRREKGRLGFFKWTDETA